jgi:hypothetical protein
MIDLSMLVGRSGPGREDQSAKGIHDRTEQEPWSTFGPHAIGAERFLAVSSGLRRYIVRPGRGCHPGETSPGQNPDKTPMAVGRHEG